MRRKALFYRRVLAIILGLALFAFILLVPPESIINIFLFYLLISLNLLNLLSLYINIQKTIFYTLFITVILMLAQFNFLNIFNFAILIALTVTIEIYFRK